MIERLSRIEGGLIGLLIGDALGVPYEFHRPEQIPPLEQIELQPPTGFARTHDVAPGTWSDDGAQALCLLDSLLQRRTLDVEDLGRRILQWAESGYLAVDQRVFDIGVQTRAALRRLKDGAPAASAGPSGERDNGNGSLMRVLPLVLWHRGPDEELARFAAEQSRVTHGHPRSQACCALYCLWARGELEGRPDAWASAASTMRQLFPLGSPLRTELDSQLRPEDPPRGAGSGYVLDCLLSARHVQRDSYEATVKAAVALGDDTDTTAAVAGGIAGIRFGLEGIPRRWRDVLRGQALLDPLRRSLRAWQSASIGQ